VDAPARWSAPELRRAMNALLPEDIRIAYAAEVASDFHPRYSAVRRSYAYRVGIDPEAESPFHSRWCWPLGWRLDREAMEDVAAAIIGDHSFLAFAKAGQEHRGNRCIIYDVGWADWGDLGL